MSVENRPGKAARVAGGALLLAVLAQVVLGLDRVRIVVTGLPDLAPSLIGRAAEPGAFTSLGLALAVLAVAATAAARTAPGTPRRLEAAGLAGLLTLAGSGVALTLLGVATRRFVPAAAWAVIALAGFVALRSPRRRDDAPPAPLSAWDGATALFLLALLVPTVFPYVHFDAKEIWGCRAVAVAASGSLEGLAECSHGGYPPLFSLLLALGGSDPVLGGRPAAWLLTLFAVLFLRGALARLSPRHAAAATLFVVATGWVWVTSAMYYANVPLMAFLTGGAVLVVGPLPGARGNAWPPYAERFAAALLFAAAALVRPDGFLYVAAVGVAVALLALRARAWPDPLPFAGAALGWAAWALRSDALRFAGTFHEQSSTWRTAGATGPEAVERILRVSLKILQQLWLAHWGLGATIWVLLGAALAVALRGRAPSRAVAAWGLVTLAGLGTVLALFAVLPFTVDVVAGVQPFRSREFLLCWDNFARVGLGRMVVHLLPAGAFFVLAVVEDSASPSS
ncbi:MAG: hypothetical protein U0529_02605 [Thermoanaerobaculia bacterium]